MTLELWILGLVTVCLAVLIGSSFKIRDDIKQLNTIVQQSNTMQIELMGMLRNNRDHEHSHHQLEESINTRMEYEQHLVLRVLNRLLSGSAQLDTDENYTALKIEITEALKEEAHT